MSVSRIRADCTDAARALRKLPRLATEWHIIAPEYPDEIGGVGDYSFLVASGLAQAGDRVHVWCPTWHGKTATSTGVTVHRDFGKFAPWDLIRVGHRLNQFSAPRWLLVQWVPHGYRLKAMNVFFCVWLCLRAVLHGDRVDVMVHEASMAFSRTASWKWNIIASTHRVMLWLLLLRAGTVWVSSTSLEATLLDCAPGHRLRIRLLPIPSNITPSDDPANIHDVRIKYAPDAAQVMGHFGTYAPAVAELLLRTVPKILQIVPGLRVLFTGDGSEMFARTLQREYPAFAARIHGTGAMDPRNLSLHLRCCDLMFQPYPDGVSCKRGTLMAALAHGLPTITTRGRTTEAIWYDSGVVALCPADDIDTLVRTCRELLANADQRARLGSAAKALYEACFELRHSIAALRGCPFEAAGAVS